MKTTQLLKSICLVLMTIGSIEIQQGVSQVKEEAQESTPDTKDGLHLSAAIDGEKFRLREMALLTVKLQNIGETPITIYKRFGWGNSSSFSYAVVDSEGKTVVKPSVLDAQDPPPFREEDFATIHPEESVKLQRWVDMKSEGIKKPGVYQIIVWYHSPISNKFAPSNLAVWTIEKGVLQSKPVTFKVTQ